MSPNQNQQNVEQENKRHKQRTAAIGSSVLHVLGEPCDWHTVQVRALWDGHFRVNIFVGSNAASARVAHSFFLEADLDGNILTASPTITKRY